MRKSLGRERVMINPGESPPAGGTDVSNPLVREVTKLNTEIATGNHPGQPHRENLTGICRSVPKKASVAGLRNTDTRTLDKTFVR